MEDLRAERSKGVAPMSEAGADIEGTRPTGFDRGFDGHWRRQVQLGLTLTPAQRLRWTGHAFAFDVHFAIAGFLRNPQDVRLTT